MASIYNQVLKSVWVWTLGGLPNWLKLPGLRRRWATPLFLNKLDERVFASKNGQLLDVRLGASFCHEKVIILPKNARSNLANFVKVNVEQTSPRGGEGLLWTYDILDTDHKHLRLAVSMYKRSDINEIIRLAQANGCSIRTICDATLKYAPPIYETRSKSDRILVLWNAVALALLIALFSTIIYQDKIEVDHLKRYGQNLKDVKSDLNALAIELKSQQENQASRNSEIEEDRALLESESSRLRLFLDLTTTLSNRSWVSELSVNGSTLRLSILSSEDISYLMQEIKGLEWVQAVELDGPISLDPISRRNRFDLRVLIGNDPMSSK